MREVRPLPTEATVSAATTSLAWQKFVRLHGLLIVRAIVNFAWRHVFLTLLAGCQVSPRCSLSAHPCYVCGHFPGRDSARAPRGLRPTVHRARATVRLALSRISEYHTCIDRPHTLTATGRAVLASARSTCSVYRNSSHVYMVPLEIRHSVCVTHRHVLD